MKINTIHNTLGTGTVHTSKEQLNRICDKVFYLYTPQLELADVTISEDIRMDFVPDYIEFIKDNQDKQVGVIIDSFKNDNTVRGHIIGELDKLPNTNVILHNILTEKV